MKMKIGRILLAAMTLLLLNSSIANARAFKIATVSPDGTFWMQEMRAGAKEIKKQTQGQGGVQVLPGWCHGQRRKRTEENQDWAVAGRCGHG